MDDARRELSDAEAGVVQATETRAAAEDLASRSTAMAPFAGIVAERWHNPGDLVDANEHVLRLVDPSRLEVEAAVLVADAGRIVVGHEARIKAPGAAAEGVPARVAGAPGAVDPATGTAIVRLALAGSLPVGAPVQAEIEAERIPDGLLVPASALVREGGKESVLLVGADGKAHRQDVHVGLRGSSEVQVLSGVAAGDSVIVKGQSDLPDGARVAPEKE